MESSFQKALHLLKEANSMLFCAHLNDEQKKWVDVTVSHMLEEVIALLEAGSAGGVDKT
jgi:hypothetical protein